MISQQIYWKSVWSETVKACDNKARLSQHSVEEERLYKKILKHARKKAGSFRRQA